MTDNGGSDVTGAGDQQVRDSLPRVKLQGHSPDPEAFMAYVARVSNPANQDNPDHARLLGYCIRHRHWSVFEHASMTLEITTTLDIATQILRHRSFCFQQLSRRYAGSSEAPVQVQLPQLRTPHPKNRQASLDSLDPAVRNRWLERLEAHFAVATALYQDMLSDGIARECARAVLPQATVTTLYMTGNCRSWIHYIALRSCHGTQLEHQQVAERARAVFRDLFPSCAAALDAIHWAV